MTPMGFEPTTPRFLLAVGIRCGNQRFKSLVLYQAELRSLIGAKPVLLPGRAMFNCFYLCNLMFHNWTCELSNVQLLLFVQRNLSQLSLRVELRSL